MELVAWLVLGAIAGYGAGAVVSDDDALGVPTEIVVGCLAGLVAGFASGWVVGAGDPINSLEPQTLVSAAVMGAVSVVLMNAVAERRALGA